MTRDGRTVGDGDQSRAYLPLSRCHNHVGGLAVTQLMDLSSRPAQAQCLFGKGS
eukprot:COSAG02_NODE_4120_length_5748_cov_5.310320_5_plen_54_part_00